MKRKDDGIDVQGKSPAFYFYPADWIRTLAPCSLRSRGLWADCLCHMHFARRRGYLEHPNGNAISEAELARMTGASLHEVQRCLVELERCGIFSRDESGVIFNRRMVRDTEISLKRKAAGKAGGNPLLVGKLDKQNQDLDNQNPNQNPTLSPSPSLSLSSSEIKGSLPPQWTQDELYSDLCATAERWGAALIDEDKANAFPMWNRLDGSQRVQALENLKARVARGDDPAYFRLHSYLDPGRGEYKRAVIPFKQRPGKMSRADSILENLRPK